VKVNFTHGKSCNFNFTRPTVHVKSNTGEDVHTDVCTDVCTVVYIQIHHLTLPHKFEYTTCNIATATAYSHILMLIIRRSCCLSPLLAAIFVIPPLPPSTRKKKWGSCQIIDTEMYQPRLPSVSVGKIPGKYLPIPIKITELVNNSSFVSVIVFY
jgi:hypothetical protein